MILRRIFNEQLAQAGYMVACDHSRLALIVDPTRDVTQYIDAAARENLRIVAVTETHIHADYVSGSRELASRTGARLYLSDAGGPGWKYAFAGESNAEMLTDGSQFMVGDVRIEAVHTPGHTPEHMTFLVTDTGAATEPMGALTGDFIFVGDVGRPDLLERAAGMSGTMDSAAKQLFASLQSFKEYPDYLQLWPGHGAGSACGKALGAMPQSTLGYEKLFNWALLETDETRFISDVLDGQPEPPAYFAIMKKVNRDGPPVTSPRAPDEIGAAGILRALGDRETIVDTRPATEFAASHVAGTINVPRNKSFLNWSGALLPYDRDVWIIAPASDAARAELARDLSLIGVTRIRGVYDAGRLDDLFAGGAPVASVPQQTAAGVRDQRTAAVVDVRTRAEYESGHIAGAVNVPLAELPRRLDELPAQDLIVHCQGGTRSAIAASLLERNGRTVSNMTGGFGEWERAGFPVEKS